MNVNFGMVFWLFVFLGGGIGILIILGVGFIF